MRTFLTVYARAVGALGLALLVGSLLQDQRWREQPVAIGVLLVAVIFLRTQQIPLTKYGALNLLAMPALAGALVAGAPTSAVSMWIGVCIADALLMRKGWDIAVINAGREVLVLLAAFGAFAWASVAMNAEQTKLNAETLPALALLIFTYFLASRLLLYFTLLLRDKLIDEEKALILRYEVIGFGAGTIAVAVILLAIGNLSPAGWALVGVVLGGAGLLVKRILGDLNRPPELFTLFGDPSADIADRPRNRLAAAAKRARRRGEGFQLVAHPRHRLEQRTPQIMDMQRGRELRCEPLHERHFLVGVGVRLVMLHLEHANGTVAKAKWKDDDAARQRAPGKHAVIAQHIIHLDCLPDANALRSQRRQVPVRLAWRIEIAFTAAPHVHQHLVLVPADAEVPPVHEPVREQLDAAKRIRHVTRRGNDLLHRENLVQLLGGDRFLQNALDE